MDINDYLKILKRRFKIIALITILGTVVAVIRSNAKQPLYTAVAKVLVNKPTTILLSTGESGIAPETIDINTQIKLIKSPLVAGRALEILGIKDGKPHSIVTAIRVFEEEETGIINISATTGDPEYSKKLANAFAFAYQEKSDVFTRETTNRVKNYLNEQINRLERDLRKLKWETQDYINGHVSILKITIAGLRKTHPEETSGLKLSFSEDLNRAVGFVEDMLENLNSQIALHEIEIEVLQKQKSSEEQLMGEHNGKLSVLKVFLTEMDNAEKSIRDLLNKLYSIDDPSEESKSEKEKIEKQIAREREIFQYAKQNYTRQIQNIDIDNRSIEQLKNQLSDLSYKRDQLLKNYTPQHPEVQVLDRQIQAQNEILKSMIQGLPTGETVIRLSDGADLKNKIAETSRDLSAALAKKRRIESDIKLLQTYLTGPAISKVQQANLDTIGNTAQKILDNMVVYLSFPATKIPVIPELKGLNNIYDTYKQWVDKSALLYKELETLRIRLEETNLKEMGQIKVKVIEEAVTPGEQASKKSTMEGVLGAILGFLLGFGLAVVLENLVETVRTTDDVATFLDLPVIGTIPYATEAEGKLVAEVPLRSAFAEAYKQLAFFVELHSLDPSIKTILFTSTKPNEGKTTSMANLGITLSQQGERVYLIDTDLRKPLLHRLFGVDNTIGLTSFLSGELEADMKVRGIESGAKLDKQTLNELIDKITKPTDYPGLSLITAGPIPLNSIELLKSQRMLQLVEILKNRADFVFFDSPPAIHVIDATVIASLIEGVVLIISANQVKREEARKVRDMLESTNARILGVALNNIDKESSEYYYHYSYYYQDKT